MSLTTLQPATAGKPQAGGLKPIHLVLVVDASGSMDSVRRSVLRAVNRTVNEQAQGEGSFQFCPFNEAVVINEPRDFAAWTPLLDGEYTPRLGTALRDSVLAVTGAVAAGVRTGQPVVAIVTDGKDNKSGASVEAVRTEVLRRLAQGWRFLFIGTNQDAVKVATDFGVPADCAMTFAQGGIGLSLAFRATSQNLLRWRSGGRIGYNESQRAEQRRLLTNG